ncbi:MAG TPA: xanthine dehydrogenase family protein subunit M [Bryobacteraceae bacterium]|jgi:carbon-monoxide dehydrogenase medium subunit|nr:xanthine dehydrogenase family protein subunit M [Bryobacteraceae bacterium]
MIANQFDYAAPATLAEALGLLADGSAKPLSGGMSLIPMMKLRLANPERLIDIGRLTELNYIREDKEQIHVGAGATHYDIETAPLLRAKCPLLAETAGHIGDIQVRNMGTIGGSVAHADPAADYPAALQALEAKIVLKSASGERTLAVADFFLDTFTTALESGEIVSEIIVPVDDASTGSSYQKFVQPASGFAIVGVAARIRRKGGKVTMARIGVTGLAGHSYRASNAEKALEAGKDAASAAASIPDGAEANSDLHASADYRRHMASNYGARAIAAALSRSA